VLTPELALGFYILVARSCEDGTVSGTCYWLIILVKVAVRLSIGSLTGSTGSGSGCNAGGSNSNGRTRTGCSSLDVGVSGCSGSACNDKSGCSGTS
jgi:hypothetical protein